MGKRLKRAVTHRTWLIVLVLLLGVGIFPAMTTQTSAKQAVAQQAVGEVVCFPVQITNNAVDDSQHDIGGGLIVWMGHDGSDYEIFAYDTNLAAPTIIQVTDNSADDLFPMTDGTQIVWYGWDGADYEIYYSDYSAGLPTNIQVTANSMADYNPVVDGGVIAWKGYDGNDEEIFMYDINGAPPSVIQLTANNYKDDLPVVADGVIAWHGWDGNDNEIFYFDTTDGSPWIYQLTDNTSEDFTPDVDNDIIVWTGDDGDYEIFAYDVNSGSPIFEQLTTNTSSDAYPHISNGVIVWENQDDDELYTYDMNAGNAMVSQLTSNGNYDLNPKISNGLITWNLDDGDYEVYFYDLNADSPMSYAATTNTLFDFMPKTDGNVIAWTQSTQNSMEIFMSEGLCAPPNIVSQPTSTAIDYDASTTLSVGANGDGIVSYQWYTGASGTTDNPINGATTSNYTTPQLKTTTSYWVRVSNEYGAVDSDAATVSVLGNLVTQDFEDKAAFKATWTTSNNLSKDKIKCNKDKDGDGIPDKFFSYEGECAWMFKGSELEKTKIKWAQDFTPTLRAVYGLTAGDSVNLMMYVDGRGVNSRLVAKVIALYTDDTRGKAKQVIRQTNDYELITDSLEITQDVFRIKLILVHKTRPSGKVFIDNIIMEAAETPIVAAGAEALPLPEAPEGFRR